MSAQNKYPEYDLDRLWCTDDEWAMGAQKPMSTVTLESWAKSWVAQIEFAVRRGLPKVYKNQIGAFAADCYAGDLPWVPEKADKVAMLIRSDRRWLIVKELFEKKYDYRLSDPVTSTELEVLEKYGVM